MVSCGWLGKVLVGYAGRLGKHQRAVVHRPHCVWKHVCGYCNGCFPLVFPIPCLCNPDPLAESHFLKEGTAQRTKATVPLVKETRRAILLSGTPALNKPKEIFQQVGLSLRGLRCCL